MKKYILLLRPHHWIKNSFVFIALIFANKTKDLDALQLSIVAFCIFSLVASGIYILNDIKDQKQDRLHPKKCQRPIASGSISTKKAAIIAIALLTIGIGWASAHGTHFLSIIVGYILMNIMYSLKLKYIAFIDVITIAIGFMLRAISGAIIINVPISNWLLICTFLLPLFLALTKRRQEILHINTKARTTLKNYSQKLLDQIIIMVLGLSLMSYILYTFNSNHPSELIITIPIVFYGIFRYLFLVYEKDEGEDSVNMLIKDIPLQITCALWITSVLLVLGYFS